MLSTFVLLPPTPDGSSTPLGNLVRTLGALVPGTIGGLVRDVSIVTQTASDEVRQVADHAGCALIEGERFADALRTAIARARSPMIFLLRAGAFVDRAFLDEVAQAFGPDQPDRGASAFVLREAPDGLIRRVLPDLAPAAGLIAQASAVDASAKDFDTLVRRVSGKRTMASRAAMAQ